MTRIVVSESVRHIQRDESYSSTPGPAIPRGLMHGMGRHADMTSCGLRVAGALHAWPELSFPRSYGPHCEECLHSSDALIDLTESEPAMGAS